MLLPCYRQLHRRPACHAHPAPKQTAHHTCITAAVTGIPYRHCRGSTMAGVMCQIRERCEFPAHGRNVPGSWFRMLCFPADCPACLQGHAHATIVEEQKGAAPGADGLCTIPVCVLPGTAGVTCTHARPYRIGHAGEEDDTAEQPCSSPRRQSECPSCHQRVSVYPRHLLSYSIISQRNLQGSQRECLASPGELQRRLGGAVRLA